MFEDVADLRAVQLGVNKHSSEAGVPSPVERFEVSNAILCDNGDAVARVELAARAQRLGKPRRPRGERAIIEDNALAQRGGRTVRMTFPGAFEPRAQYSLTHQRLRMTLIDFVRSCQ